MQIYKLKSRLSAYNTWICPFIFRIKTNIFTTASCDVGLATSLSSLAPAVSWFAMVPSYHIRLSHADALAWNAFPLILTSDNC